MKKFTAFTLAEILITLTVIGIVAVMTIPNLQNNANDSEMTSKLKKCISNLNNLGVSNYAAVGIDYSMLRKNENSENPRAYSLNSFIRNRMQVSSTDSTPSFWDIAIKGDIKSTYILADGSAIGFDSSKIGTCYSMGNCMIYVDVNGSRGPNMLSAKTAKNDGKFLGDQYKVFIFAKAAAPADDAAKFAMYDN